MATKKRYAVEVKESRRTCKVPVRFLVQGEEKKITVDKDLGWTAEYAGKFNEGVALNIDINGLLVATNPDKAPSVGSKIIAVFELERIGKIQVEGDVVWVNKYSPHYPKGFALKFSDVSTNAKKLREGIDNSYVPEVKVMNGADVLSIPD